MRGALENQRAVLNQRALQNQRALRTVVVLLAIVASVYVARPGSHPSTSSGWPELAEGQGRDGREDARDVLVFAAASLQTAFDALVVPLERVTGGRVRVSYAASSALARQIENGAPADLFISADLEWMDHLAGRQLIRADSRADLLGNRLVLIAPAGQPVTMKIAPGFGLAAALGRDRLALADPAAVPAGKYARAALTSLGVWDAVAGRIAAAENVRAALRLVSRREAPLGIVYYSDAVADTGVRIVDTFPESAHPAIVYPAALTSTASPAAAKVLEYLQSNEARAVFAAQGFKDIPRSS
jgi:molybdate transport system substrate-binding protein